MAKKKDKTPRTVGMCQSLVRVFEEAQMLGYTAIDVGSAGIQLTSWDRSQHIIVPRVRQFNSDRLRSLHDKVVRYADPVLVEKYMAVREAMTPDERAIAKAVAAAAEAVENSTVAAVPPIKENEMQKVDSVPANDAAPVIEPVMVRMDKDDKNSELVPSKAVLKRVWPNGVVEYQCAIENCTYVADKSAKVQGHYTQHKARLEGKKRQGGRNGSPPKAAEPPVVVDEAQAPPEPTQEPLWMSNDSDKMGDALMKALPSRYRTMTKREIAEVVVHWMLDHRVQIERTMNDGANMSDAQIIERIRDLVSAPLRRNIVLMEEQMRVLISEKLDLQDRIEALSKSRAADADSLLDEIDSLRTEVARLKEERKAVAEMLLGK